MEVIFIIATIIIVIAFSIIPALLQHWVYIARIKRRIAAEGGKVEKIGIDWEAKLLKGKNDYYRYFRVVFVDAEGKRVEKTIRIGFSEGGAPHSDETITINQQS